MADGINVPLTGSGDATAKLLTDDTGATGHAQVVKLAQSVDGSPTLIPADTANGLDVDVTRVPTDPFGANADAAVVTDTTGTMNGKLRGLVKWAFERMPASLGQKTKANSLPVVLASDSDALTISGSVTISGQAEDAAHVSGDVGLMALGVRKATPANTSGTDGDYEPFQVSGGRLWASALIDTALPAGNNNIGDVDIATAPAAARTTDSVAAAAQTDALMNGLTALTPKFAQINRATNADGAAVVNLVAGKKIRVVRLTFVCAAAVGVKWQSSTSNSTGVGSNTDLTPVMSFAANGGVSDAYCPLGLFETVLGEALKLNLNGAQQVSGYLTYVEV